MTNLPQTAVRLETVLVDDGGDGGESDDGEELLSRDGQ